MVEKLTTPVLAIPVGWVVLGGDQTFYVERAGQTHRFAYVPITIVGSLLHSHERAFYDGRFLDPTKTLDQERVWPDATIKAVIANALPGAGKTTGKPKTVKPPAKNEQRDRRQRERNPVVS